MKITITKSGISFGSLVKLFSVGHFIGIGILMFFSFVAISYLKRGDPIPLFFWLMFPIMLAVQSLFVAVVVAAGVKLYGKVGKFETPSCERPLQHLS